MPTIHEFRAELRRMSDHELAQLGRDTTLPAERWQAVVNELRLRSKRRGPPPAAPPVAPAAPATTAITAAATPSAPAPVDRRVVDVRVRDIEMSFASMVTFMVRGAIASIPAVLVVALLGFGFLLLLGALSNSLGALFAPLRR